ncbi:MAG: YHYH protein [Acidobacteriota bacterium]
MRQRLLSLTVLATALLLSMQALAQCPTEHFPTLSPHPANAAYPDPVLDVSCDATTLIIESNGIPGFEFVQVTPNGLRAQDWTFRIPLNPELPAEWTEIPLLGTIGVGVNGLPAYGPNEGPHPDPWGDPVHAGVLDDHFGHTARDGDYHFHAMLVETFHGTPDVPGEPSPIIGYASDGFPIHGPWGCVDLDCTEVIRFESGWEQTGDPTTYAWDNHEYVEKPEPQYLDRCNGRIGPDGTYRYHATDTFPYILGCYAGLDVLRTPAPTAPPPVPDGAGDGDALRVTRLDADGTRLQVTWDDSCLPETTKLIHGDLDQVAALEPLGAACNVGQPVEWNDVPAGNLWFLLVSDAADVEGSWGHDSFGERRPLVSSGTCGTTSKDVTGRCTD